MAEDTFVVDRLIALKHAYGDVGAQPFDIRDDRSCSYRVLANLIMLEQIGDDLEREGRRTNRALLTEYAAGDGLATDLRRDVLNALCVDDASQAALSALVGRCVAGTRWGTLAAAPNARAAQAHAELLRRMEDRYRAVCADGPPTSAAGMPQIDLAALADHLGDGEPARLRVLHMVNGGYSKVTIICELERRGQPARKVVVRSDAGLAFAGTSVLDEYPVLQALHAAGVAVPAPIWAGRLSDDMLPLLVVEFAEGSPFGSPAAAEVRNEALCRDMAAKLARIHGVDPALLGRVEGDGAAHNRAAVARELDAKSAQMQALDRPMPLLEYALAWLRNGIAVVGGSIAIVHGDYAPHNLLAVGDEVRAILDWEFVKLGNPAEDLCFGRLAIEELGGWDLFVAAYEAAGGSRPSDDEVRFYTVFSLYRLCVMMMRTETVLKDSSAKPIRMATPGAERLRPTLLKLAALLDLDVAGKADHAG